MSRENVELAKRIEDAVNRRDVEAIEEVFHPKFEFHSALARAEGGIYEAPDGMRQYFRDIDATWPDFTIELQDIREAGDQLVVIWRVRGTSRSGVPLDLVNAQVWTWRDGMPWRNESYTDPRDALAAVGLAD